MRDDLLTRLRTMPGFLESAASRFPEQEARRPGPGGGFGFLEHVWHLADLERCYGERIGRILREERPHLPDFDGARVAREGRYRERGLAAGLAEFRKARTDSLTHLSSVAEAQWRREATQEGVGDLRLEDVPRMMAEHDASHRAEVRELLGEAPAAGESLGSRAMARALGLLLVVPLLGCPYEAPFPLAAGAGTPREAMLLGAWRCVSGSEEKSLLMTLTPRDPEGYSVVMTQAGEKPYTVLAQATTVKSVLSAEEIESERPGPRYFFARYSMPNADAVAWELADDELLKDLPKTPAALQSALEGPKRDEIFKNFCVCTRAEAKLPPPSS